MNNVHKKPLINEQKPKDKSEDILIITILSSNNSIYL